MLLREESWQWERPGDEEGGGREGRREGSVLRVAGADCLHRVRREIAAPPHYLEVRKQTFDSEFVQGSISLGVAEQRLELQSGAFRQTSSWPWPPGGPQTAVSLVKWLEDSWKSDHMSVFPAPSAWKVSVQIHKCSFSSNKMCYFHFIIPEYYSDEHFGTPL